MLARLLAFFQTGPDRPLFSDDPREIKRVYEQKRWSVFLSLTFGYGMFYVARTNLGVAKAGDKGLLAQGVFDATELGLIGTGLFVAYMVGRTLNGFLADRANIRRFMATALLASAATNLALSFQSSFWLFFFLWTLNGWFQSVGAAPSGASLRQWFSSREYGTRYGIWSSSHGIGTAITFYVTSRIVERWGWEWGFFGPAIVCAGTSLVLFKTLMDRPRTYGLPDVADYKHDHPLTTNGSAALADVGKAQKAVVTNPAIWIMGLAAALMYVCRYGLNSWGSVYLEQTRGFSLTESGDALTIYTAATVAGAVASGWISDRLFGARRNLPALLSGVVIVASLLALHFGPSEWRFVVDGSLAVFGFALGAQLAYLGGLWAVDLSPTRAAGAAMGLIGGFSYAGAAIQDTLSGILIDLGKRTAADGAVSYDFTYAFWFWLGTAVVSCLLVLAIWNARPQAE